MSLSQPAAVGTAGLVDVQPSGACSELDADSSAGCGLRNSGKLHYRGEDDDAETQDAKSRELSLDADLERCGTPSAVVAKMPYCCSDCDLSFPRYSHLREHMQVHADRLPYACEQCGMRFKAPSLLASHKRTHTGERPYACEQCDKSFAWSSGLVSHRRIHTAERHYACDTCGLQFSQSSKLVRHQRMHTGVWPFTCGVCGKQLSSATSLARHVRMHTGERSHACDQCDKRFAWRSDLTRHKEKMHVAKHSSIACSQAGDTSGVSSAPAPLT